MQRCRGRRARGFSPPATLLLPPPSPAQLLSALLCQEETSQCETNAVPSQTCHQSAWCQSRAGWMFPAPQPRFYNKYRTGCPASCLSEWNLSLVRHQKGRSNIHQLWPTLSGSGLSRWGHVSTSVCPDAISHSKNCMFTICTENRPWKKHQHLANPLAGRMSRMGLDRIEQIPLEGNILEVRL